MAAPAPYQENPFPGLRSFTSEESHLFFGREGQCDELLRKMGRRRFVAVVGVSGCGKSSLVRAGLLPSLYNGYLASAGAEWRVADLRPGGDPIGNLAAALRTTGFWKSGELTAELLRSSSLALVATARKARDSGQWGEDENLLILADQFEELFRYPVRQESMMADRDEKAGFVKLLLEAANQQDVPIYVVVTMRSDFLGDCAQFRDLPEAINDGQYLIPRMTREQRRTALEAPVRAAGGAIAPRLVQRILNDTGEDPGQLPVMQHALMRTWDHWRACGSATAAMDIEDYEAIGTLAQALSAHADDACQEASRKLGGRGEEIVKRIFQRLRDRDVNGREVRRPTPLGELCEIAEASRDEMLVALECFRRQGRTFLMPGAAATLRDDSLVDVTHECLLRQWQRLVEWVNEELESGRIFRRLADRAEEQETADHPDYLKGTQLQIALDWWERRRPCAAWARRYHPGFASADGFLQASRRYRDAERQRAEEAQREAEERRTAEARREQEEKEARIRAQAETRERELRKHGAYVMAGLALLAALISGAFGLKTWQQMKVAQTAVHNYRTESSKRRQLEEARHQFERAKMEDVRRAKEETDEKNRELNRLAKHIEEDAARLKQSNEEYHANEMASEANSILGRGSEQAAKLALEGFRSLRLLGKPPTFRVQDALHQVAGAWRLRLSLTGFDKPVQQLAFSPDGEFLVTVTEDGALKRWNSFTGDSRTLEDKGVAAVAFSATGEMVTGSDDGALRVINIDSSRPASASPLAGSPIDSRILAVAISPDAKRVAYSSNKDNGYGVHLLDRATGREIRKLEPKGMDTIRSLAFSPNGRRLAMSGERDNAAGRVEVWDVETASTVAGSDNVPYPAQTVAFSGDGGWIGVAGEFSVDLLNASNGNVVRRLPEQPQGIKGIAFSADGDPGASRLITAGLDGTARVWKASNGQLLLTLRGHNGEVRAVAFSPDGTRVATAGQDATARIWDTGPTRELRTFEAHADAVNAVAVQRPARADGWERP